MFKPSKMEWSFDNFIVELSAEKKEVTIRKNNNIVLKLDEKDITTFHKLLMEIDKRYIHLDKEYLEKKGIINKPEKKEQKPPKTIETTKL